MKTFKKANNVYYFNSYILARDKLNALQASNDATSQARINSFGRGWAIQERKSGRYWGDVVYNCPETGLYLGEGWAA